MLVFSLTYLVGKIVSDPIRLLEGQVYVFCSATTLPKFVTGVPSRLGRHQASRRKVFQICKRGSRHGVVDRVTKKPNMNVSPWPRGVPDSGSPRLIRWIRSRRSRLAFGRPALFLDFQHQNALSPAHETCGREAQEGSRVFSLNAPVSFPSLRNIAGHAAFQRPNETIATGFLMRKNLLLILG